MVPKASQLVIFGELALQLSLASPDIEDRRHRGRNQHRHYERDANGHHDEHKLGQRRLRVFHPERQ